MNLVLSRADFRQCVTHQVREVRDGWEGVPDNQLVGHSREEQSDRQGQPGAPHWVHCQEDQRHSFDQELAARWKRADFMLAVIIFKSTLLKKTLNIVGFFENKV